MYSSLCWRCSPSPVLIRWYRISFNAIRCWWSNCWIFEWWSYSSLSARQGTTVCKTCSVRRFSHRRLNTSFFQWFAIPLGGFPSFFYLIATFVFIYLRSEIFDKYFVNIFLSAYNNSTEQYKITYYNLKCTTHVIYLQLYLSENGEWERYISRLSWRFFWLASRFKFRSMSFWFWMLLAKMSSAS